MPADMPLKPTTIRFAEDGAKLIQKASDQVGCTFSQFVREAALMRAVVVAGEDFEKLSEQIVRLARRDD